MQKIRLTRRNLTENRQSSERLMLGDYVDFLTKSKEEKARII